MCNISTILIIIAVNLFVIITIFNYKKCIKEYKYIRNLTLPITRIQVYPIPVTTGALVENIDEEVPVITIRQ